MGHHGAMDYSIGAMDYSIKTQLRDKSACNKAIYNVPYATSFKLAVSNYSTDFKGKSHISKYSDYQKLRFVSL